jgi:hypothetical protein
MAHIDTHDGGEGLETARRSARQAGSVQHVQFMLMAAGLAAFGIVAVAAAMVTTLL